MSTLHIMIASGENLPNLIPALARLTGDETFKADKALILSSTEMRLNSSVLKQALNHSGIDASIYPQTCPDADLPTIRQWAKRVAEETTSKYPEHRRILNLTGGNKLMTIAFLEAFRTNNNAEIVYCDTAHDRIEYISEHSGVSQLPPDLLSLQIYLAAQGYKIRPGAPDTIAIKARRALTTNMATSAAELGRLIQKLNHAWYEYETRRNFDVSVRNDGLSEIEKGVLKQIRNLQLLDNTLRFRDENAARYLGGGWLEEWCWLIGKELETDHDLHSNRWGTNLTIEPLEARPIPGRNIYTRNELDAAFVHRNRMLIIECKTGAQLASDESQDILNKLEVLGSKVSGRLNTKWLLTARRVDPKEPVWDRAKRYDIEIIKPEELGNLKTKLQEWMTK